MKRPLAVLRFFWSEEEGNNLILNFFFLLAFYFCGMAVQGVPIVKGAKRTTNACPNNDISYAYLLSLLFVLYERIKKDLSKPCGMQLCTVNSMQGKYYEISSVY